MKLKVPNIPLRILVDRPGFVVTFLILAVAVFVGWRGYAIWHDGPLDRLNVADGQLRMNTGAYTTITERLKAYHHPPSGN